jgi:hypothetical protein
MLPTKISDNLVLSPEESGYLRGLLHEHLNYYRLLAGNPKCSPSNRAKLAMLEALWLKLSR